MLRAPTMIAASSILHAFLALLALFGQSNARLINYPGQSLYHNAGRGLRAFRSYGNEPYVDDQGAFDASSREIQRSHVQRPASQMEDVFVDDGFDTPNTWETGTHFQREVELENPFDTQSRMNTASHLAHGGDAVISSMPNKEEEEEEEEEDFAPDDRSGRSGNACSTKKDCEPGRLCVDGDCLCPIIPGLTESMKRGCHIDPKVWKSKGGRKWCILPVSDFDTELEYKDTYVLDGARSHPTMDLPHLADWSTCAVVGSSGNMRKKNLGPEIDSHTAVIRFNDAPTKGYEEFVGRKTTMRIQNVEYCGFSERKGEILVHYTLPKKDKCKKAMELAPHFLEYEMGYFKQSKEEKPAGMPRSDPSGGEQKLSGGFMGIAMAMHLCGKIDIYGFSESEIHYYDKNMEVGQAHDFKERHNWNYEHACIRQLSRGSMARVKVHG